MPEHNDFFSPHRVDESVEQLFARDQSMRASRFQGSADPNARLVEDLQKLYSLERKQYLRALQRVENRLVEQYATGEKDAVANPAAPGQQQRSPRKLQQGRLYHMEQRYPSKFGRRISVLVAVLIMALLVGSLVVVLNVTHQKSTVRQQNPTTLGSAQHPTSAPHFGKTLYVTPSNTYGFEALAWSPDSQRVAALADGAQIWDATTGKHLVKVQLSTQLAYALAWSPNSQMLAIGTAQGVVIVNGSTGAIVHTYAVNSTASAANVTNSPYLAALMPASGGLGVRSIAWSPNGSQIAVAISLGASGSIEVLNAQNGAPAFTLPITGNYVADALAWSSDGKYVAANVFNTEPGNQTVPQAEEQMIWAWNVSTRQVVFKQSGGNGTGDPLAWQPGSDKLAFVTWTPKKGGGMTSALAVWNVATGKLDKQYQAGAFGPVAWSPDGKYLAYSGSLPGKQPEANLVVILDAQSGQTVYVYRQHKSIVGALAWSPNGKYIVSGEGNTEGNMVARVWTAE